MRDLLTLAALALVLLLAGVARSEEPKDILSILSSNDPLVQRVLEKNLDVDRAADELRAPKAASETVATRAPEAEESLGIGALGGEEVVPNADFLPDAERVRAEAIVARATRAVGECYGEPMRDAESRYDSLVVRVIFDTKGEVVGTRVVQATRFGQRNTETCVTQLLEQLHFPAGLTADLAKVGYRWTFDLGTSTTLRFAANE